MMTYHQVMIRKETEQYFQSFRNKFIERHFNLYRSYYTSYSNPIISAVIKSITDCSAKPRLISVIFLIDVSAVNRLCTFEYSAQKKTNTDQAKACDLSEHSTGTSAAGHWTPSTLINSGCGLFYRSFAV